MVAPSFRLSIPRPLTKITETELLGRNLILTLLEDCDWPHGEFVLDIAQEHRGLMYQWVAGWRPTDDTEVCLVVEDDVDIFPGFYAWLKPRLERCAALFLV